MADVQFKPGDVVTLKSGGPRMTIASMDEKSALCEWFSDDQHAQGKSFALTSLRLEERR